MEREIDTTDASLFIRVRPASSEKETPKSRNNHYSYKTKINSLSTSHLPFQTIFKKQIEIPTTEETTTENLKDKKEQSPKCPPQLAPRLVLVLTFLVHSRTKRASSNSQRHPSQELFLPQSRSCCLMERSPPAN